jgi:hypothetical protein
LGIRKDLPDWCAWLKIAFPIGWMAHFSPLITSVADPDPNPIRIHRIHMFLGLLDPDPDPLVRGIDSCFFVTLFDFLSLKNDANLASKSNKHKKLY